MKVGILTLPLWNNYGGILQAYALIKALNNHDFETVLIDLHRKRPTKYKEFVQKVKNQVKKTFINKHKLTVYPDIKQSFHISKNTLNFVGAELHPKTQTVYALDELRNISDDLEAVIVGSDQVWRPNYTPNIYNYFLDFTDKDTKKLSYAASFGTDEWLFTDEETSRCKDLLARFDAVSIRENTAVSIVNDKFGIKPDFVLDPTLLLDVDDYMNLVNKYSDTINNAELFTYILDRSHLNKEFVDRVSNDLGYKSFEVMPKQFDIDFSYKNDEYIFPNLTQWLRSFHDAKFVIADSFHGCVFSIIFNKPFIAIGNPERGLSRFYSLLKTFGLEERLVLNVEDFDVSILNKEIDWSKVNDIRNKHKIKSMKFLLESLGAK